MNFFFKSHYISYNASFPVGIVYDECIINQVASSFFYVKFHFSTFQGEKKNSRAARRLTTRGASLASTKPLMTSFPGRHLSKSCVVTDVGRRKSCINGKVMLV